MAKSLLHTGFAKAGSTFLQEWFERNPQLHYTRHAFAGFSNVFSMADLVHAHPNPQYRYFVTSNELLGSGGRIPYGCALFCFRMLRGANLREGQKNICSLLHDIFPDSRVLIVTRGFSGIIRSLYSQYIKLGGEFDFHGFLDAYKPILVQWLDVDYNLRLYRDAFGDESVIVLPYELLKHDPRTFVRTLETALELEPTDEIPGMKNPSLAPNQLYWYSLLSRYIVTPLADMFSPATAGRIYSFYSFKVVQPNRLGRVIQLMNRIGPRSTDLSYPDGYLDTFRGMAESLTDNELYEPFLDEYLIGSVSVRKRPNNQAASAMSM